jgi:DNA-binding CsgD family transcriptional regulator
MEELSAVLLGLYSAARRVPLGEFQDAALALIQPLVAFTSAAWGSGRVLADGLAHHSVHLMGDPPDRLMDYEEVKHQDIAAFTVGKNPGRAFAFHAPSLFREHRYAGIREYAKRWDHQSYILASRVDTESGLLQWVGVYRGDADDQYSETERQLIELLLPHLNEALGINRILNLRRESPAALHGAAIVDRFGVLHHADAQFLEFMQRECPRSGGRSLPPALIEHLGRSPGNLYSGRWIVLRARPIRDLLLLHARHRTRVDDLTPRQLAVARQVADGLPYKKIAQRLGLSPATVRNYAQTIYERLGVHSRHELTAQLKAAQF